MVALLPPGGATGIQGSPMHAGRAGWAACISTPSGRMLPTPARYPKRAAGVRGRGGYDQYPKRAVISHTSHTCLYYVSDVGLLDCTRLSHLMGGRHRHDHPSMCAHASQHFRLKDVPGYRARGSRATRKEVKAKGTNTVGWGPGRDRGTVHHGR